MISDGSIFINVYASMKRVLIGFAISTAIGVPLGIFFGIYSGVYEYFKSLINFLRNTPPLALIPMLILWFGIGEESKIIVFEFSKLQIIFKIIIPNAILDIAVGLKLALGYSFRAIIGAELVAASSGLGYLISDGKEMSRTDVVIVGIIVIGLLGIITDYIFSIIVKKVSKGKMVEAYE